MMISESVITNIDGFNWNTTIF